jgi:hypothetical protein
MTPRYKYVPVLIGKSSLKLLTGLGPNWPMTEARPTLLDKDIHVLAGSALGCAKLSAQYYETLE